MRQCRSWLRQLSGRLATVRYTSSMTRTLDAAIAKLATLPPDEQDRVAHWLLDELRDEEHWTRQFAASQDTLSKLAAEARADLAASRTTPLDIEKL
jgi:hypothetical protein